MRLSREAKARHHDEIVVVGARMLRERGIEGTSVADLMQAAGLTHGGFYRHFESKDAFVREATVAAFAAVAAMRDACSGTPQVQLATYADYYLSDFHFREPGNGCPIAAFGAEAVRSSSEVQEAFGEGVAGVVGWIAERLTIESDARQTRASQILALLVGAVVTGRASGDSESSMSIRMAAREQVMALIG